MCDSGCQICSNWFRLGHVPAHWSTMPQIIKIHMATKSLFKLTLHGHTNPALALEWMVNTKSGMSVFSFWFYLIGVWIAKLPHLEQITHNYPGCVLEKYQYETNNIIWYFKDSSSFTLVWSWAAQLYTGLAFVVWN